MFPVAPCLESEGRQTQSSDLLACVVPSLSRGIPRSSAIIIEVGAGYTKCGIAGEAEPRSIIPTNDTVRALLLARVLNPLILLPARIPGRLYDLYGGPIPHVQL